MSDGHDTMPGELRIVICGETLYHLLARTLKLMMQDTSSLRPQPQPPGQSELLTTDKNIYNTFGPIITFLHHLLSANYPAFVPSQRRFENIFVTEKVRF